MATIKKCKSLTRRKRARAHDKIFLPKLVKCSNSNCNIKTLSHRICSDCGFYKGKCIIKPKLKNQSKNHIISNNN